MVLQQVSCRAHKSNLTAINRRTLSFGFVQKMVKSLRLPRKFFLRDDFAADIEQGLRDHADEASTRYDNDEEEGSDESSYTFDSFFDDISFVSRSSEKPSSKELTSTPSAIFKPTIADEFPPPAYLPDPTMIEEGNFHAWCVDTSGDVVDFPDEMLKHGKYQTDEIVRRAWDARLVAFHLPELERHSLEFWKDPFHRSLSNEEVEKMAWKNILPLYFKYERAKAIRDSNPEKYALVVGSLGYRQSDGSVFWEFGAG